MNAPDHNLSLNALPIPDVQSTPDTRQLAIARVGVKGVRYPVQVTTPRGVQPSVATFNLYVHLPAEQKGTHMSRFIAMLESQRAPLNWQTLQDMGEDMLQRLEAQQGRIEITYPYFINKVAPVSGVESLLDYEVAWVLDCRPDAVEITLKVVVPVTSLCPCSKKISDYGAHNQRSHVTVTAQLKQDLDVEALVRMIEDQASCELYGLLKRPDEKYVTERAYDNPKFVEDLVRDVAVRLNSETAIGRYVIEAENFESIHNHSAYALIERA